MHGAWRIPDRLETRKRPVYGRIYPVPYRQDFLGAVYGYGYGYTRTRMTA